MNKTSYFRRLFYFVFLALFISTYSFGQQCQATTKKGTQCKRNAQSGSVYCWQHAGSNSELREKKSDVAPEKSPVKENVQKSENKTSIERENSTSGRCQATTKKGTQCKRNAKSGSKYCWQHGQ